MQGRRNIETNILDLTEAREVLEANEEMADRISAGRRGHT